MYKLILYEESTRLPLREVTGFASKQDARRYRQGISLGVGKFWHIMESEPYTDRPFKKTENFDD